MAKRKPQYTLDNYTQKLQEQYQKDLLEKICEVLVKKGIIIQSEDEFAHILKERMKKSIFDGLTTWFLDGNPICASGELNASMKDKEISTSFQFVEL